jgi:hypothetical protein
VALAVAFLALIGIIIGVGQLAIDAMYGRPAEARNLAEQQWIDVQLASEAARLHSGIRCRYQCLGVGMDHFQAEVFAVDFPRHLTPLLAVHLVPVIGCWAAACSLVALLA